MKTFIIGTSGTIMELPSFAPTIELLTAILSVQQTEDINGLYEDKKFAEIIHLCKRNHKLIYIEDAEKTTLLGRACQDGHVDLVRQFLEIPGIDISKGKINFINQEWNLSGFDVAIQSCQKEVIKLFLLYGYKFECNADGERVFRTGGIVNKWLNDVASLEEELEKINTVVEEAEKDVKALYSRVEARVKAEDIGSLFNLARNEPDLFTWIIKEKPEYLGVKNYMEQNLLYYAARKGMVELAEKLIKSGAFDLNSRDTKGFTVADYALCENRKEVVEALLKNGATDSKLVELYQSYTKDNNKQKSQKYKENAKLFFSVKEALEKDVSVTANEFSETHTVNSDDFTDQEQTVLSGDTSYSESV